MHAIKLVVGIVCIIPGEHVCSPSITVGQEKSACTESDASQRLSAASVMPTLIDLNWSMNMLSGQGFEHRHVTQQLLRGSSRAQSGRVKKPTVNLGVKSGVRQNHSHEFHCDFKCETQNVKFHTRTLCALARDRETREPHVAQPTTVTRLSGCDCVNLNLH